MSRTTIYRHWESIIDLNHDLAIFTVADTPSWQVELLRQPVGRPWAESIARAVEQTGPEQALLVRSFVAGWPASSAARAFVAKWETAWLVDFEHWLDAHCAATGRVPLDGTNSRSLAVTLAAMVEGQLIVGQYGRGPSVDDWDASVPSEIAMVTTRILDRMSEVKASGRTVPAKDWAPEPLPHSGLTTAKASILLRTVEAVRAHPFGYPCSPVPSRLVDMGRLARKLDVTERRLFDVWPTTASLNVDLLERFFERYRAAAEDVAGEVLDIGLSDRYRSFEQLNTSALHEVVYVGLRPGRASFWGCGPAVMDPEVRSIATTNVEHWLGSLRTTFLAVLSMIGWYRRVDVSADEFTLRVLEGVIGLQRMASLNHDLLNETAPYRRYSLSLCGLAAYQISRSLSTDEPPIFTDPSQAPPFPSDYLAKP